MRHRAVIIVCMLAFSVASQQAAEADGGALAAPQPTAPAGQAADATVETILLRALDERGIDMSGASLELVGDFVRPARSAKMTLTVERLVFQPAGQRFTAVLAAVTPGGSTQRFTIGGRLRQAIEVPVLTRRLRAGEVISSDDLQLVSVRDRGLPTNAVYDARELIGHAAKRSLVPGAPLVATDVKRPTVVPRGALVTLVLSSPKMQLTARGKALEEGGEGQSIRVANAQSHAVVAGVVLASGQVAVDTLLATPAAGATR
jgi:flagella basal body P-ring formation protein FlgA